MQTQNYTNAALLRNHLVMPAGLSAGGKLIWIRTGFSVSVCNAWAVMLGLGREG